MTIVIHRREIHLLLLLLLRLRRSGRVVVLMRGAVRAGAGLGDVRQRRGDVDAVVRGEVLCRGGGRGRGCRTSSSTSIAKVVVVQLHWTG